MVKCITCQSVKKFILSQIFIFYYSFPLLMFLLFLVFFTIALVLAAREQNPSNYNHGSLDAFRLFCEIVSIVYLIGDVVLEVFEFIRT